MPITATELKNFKFTPWDDYREDQTPDTIPVEEPPCKFCKHWFPHRQYVSKGNYIGIRLCNSDVMFNDFSCFEKRQ